MIPKGTTVRITTTNGGEITAELLEAYRPTYDAVLDHPKNTGPFRITWTRIDASRIKTIEQVV